MDLTLIVAVDKKGAIGKNNQLLFSCPEDMRWFKENTINKPVIMGRKTFESIGRPLPNRSNIVLTRDPQMGYIPGVMVANTLIDATNWASYAPTDEIMIIGGGEIYQQAMAHMATRLLVTHFDTVVEGADAFFPEINPNEWAGQCIKQGDATNFAIPFSFWEYRRVAPQQ